MKILKCLEQLVHDEGCLVFAEELIVDNVCKQLATFAILQDKEAYFVPLPNFIKFYNIGMVQFLKYRDLVNECLEILDAFFLNCFDSKFLFCLSFLREVNYAKSSR